MKRLLSLLAAVGLTVTTGATVVACRNCGPNNQNAIDLATIQFNDQIITLPSTNTYTTQAQVDAANSQLQGSINSQIIAAQADYLNDFTTNLEDLIKVGDSFEPGTPLTVTITANRNSTLLRGTNTITAILQNQSVAQVLEGFTDLKFFNADPTDAEVLARIKELTGIELNPQDVDITVTPPGSVTIDAVLDGMYVAGPATLTYEVRATLDTAIANKDLGGFFQAPTADQILAAINANNTITPPLEASEVTIGQPDGEKVVITAIDNTPENRFQGSTTLDYHLSTNLGEIVKNTDLGFFNADPTVEQALAAVNAKNPGLNIQASEVTINPITGGTATMTATADSRFEGTVNLTYEIAQQLSAAITNTNLGSFFQDPTSEQILAAINANNTITPPLQASEVTIGQASGGNVEVTAANVAGNRFQGSVNLTYVVTNDLGVIVANKDLGLFNEDPTAQQVIDAVNQLNPGLNIQASEVTVNPITGGTATMTAVAGSRFEGTVDLTYQIRPMLDTEIGTKDLGFFAFKPTANQIVAAINAKNNGLNLQNNEVTINAADITDTQAIVTAKPGTRFQGSATVTFIIQADLSTAIANKDLGYFPTDPDATQVIAAINAQNPSLNLQASEVTVGTASGGQVTVTAVANTRFRDSANLTYQLQTPLATAIANKDLGYFPTDPDATQVIAAINAKNNGLNLQANEVTVGTASGGQVTVTAVANTRFDGAANLTYQLQTPLASVIVTTALPNPLGDILPATILAAVNLANLTNLTLSEVTIVNATNTGASIEAVVGGPYSGSVPITFTIL